MKMKKIGKQFMLITEDAVDKEALRSLFSGDASDISLVRDRIKALEWQFGDVFGI